MPRCSALARRFACICALTLAVASPSAGSGQLNAIATEVYRIDFESGLGAVAVVSPSATLTEDPAEVLEGTRSLKLDGPGATVVLRPDLLPLQPSKIYIVEYRYRALTPGTPLALGVGFSLTGPDGQSVYVPLRGPVASVGSVGVDSRSARAGGGPNDAFVFHSWGGAVVIDDIRILRHDVQATAPAPPLVTSGFPRLANYELLAPDTIALINGVSQDGVEEVAARYDLMMGASFDHTLGAASWTRRLRMKNPGLRILPYKQAFMAQFDGGIEGAGLLSLFNAGLPTSWFMRGPSGEVLAEPAFPQNVQLNHTRFGEVINGRTVNTYTADFLADQMLTSGLWAGIHFDQPEWYINPLLGTPPPPVDLDGDGVAELTGTVQHAWALGFFDYFTTMSKRLGTGALLFGNAGHIPGNPMVLPMLNGWEGEVVSPYPILPGGEWATGEPSKWYRLVSNYLLATTYARAPQIVSLEFTGRELGDQTGTLTPNGYPQRVPRLEWRDYRRMRLGLTTALLGNGFFEYDLVDNTTPPLWFDEFAVDARGVSTTALSGKGYLGQPLGAAQELPFASRVVFQLDFESPATPEGVTLGQGTVSTNPAQVISGAASLVVRQDDIAEGKWLFLAAPTLVPGRTYQLFADYRILDYHPTTFAGLLGIGFSDDHGTFTEERSGSLYLPDTGGPGQQGTLRAAVRASRADTPIAGGLTDTGTVAIDNVRLIEGTGGVWRRDFENGIVLVNPTPEPMFVSQADVTGPRHRTGVKRVLGNQVPTWNDGSPVNAGIWLGSGDGIVLLAAAEPTSLPSAPGAAMVSAGDSAATLVWPAVSEYVAGYLVRYGEANISGELTRNAAAGPKAWVQLTDLTPGTAYIARITAHDFLGREGPPVEIQFTTTGVSLQRPVFALSPESTSIAPGSVVTLEGSGLANEQMSSSGPAFPLTMGGTTVQVNGIAAALIAVAPGRISFITPWEVAGSEAVISVSLGGVAGPERRAPIVSARPWLLTWSGGDVSIASHGNGTLIGAGSPAVAGESIDLLAVGLGAVLPHPDSGTPAGGPHGARVTVPIEVRIGGVTADVLGAWLVSGTAATYGIRVKVPEGASPGLEPVEITVGGVPGNLARVLVQ